jgi:uroporphyrin-III C-methyltransferase
MSGFETRQVVHIVGTGPGDTELLTVMAVSVIRSADIVLYDCRTVEPALSLVAPSARIQLVERASYEHGLGDREATPMVSAIREHHLAGLRVVRLKAGDPTLFGGEVDECDVLGRLGVPYTIVPGVSAGAAAAAAYALPISRKFESDAVLSIIAAEITDDFALMRDAARLLQHGASIVLYMATANLPAILQVFLEEGVPASMPLVAVSKAGWPEESCLESTLGEMQGFASTSLLKEPVVYTIGRYVRVRTRSVPAEPGSAIFSKCSP